MSTTVTHFKPSPPKRQTGLSLVELMISLTIGLILLIGITTLIVQQSSSRDELEKSSRQIENGRYAMQILHDDIEHAGYYGEYFNFPAPGSIPNPCLTDLASLDAAILLPIQGYDSSTLPASLPSCIPSGNYKPGTDILVIRRTDTYTTLINTAAGGTGGQVYLQTTAASQVMNTGSAANTTTFPLVNTQTIAGVTTSSPAPLRSYFVRIYFISPCDIPANGSTCNVSSNGTGPDDNGKPIPTLKRLELSALGGTTTFTLTTLVEGIVNMQLDYGLDNAPAPPNGDGYPDIYSTCSACTVTDWPNVMAIRVNLLAQNTECSTGFTDTKSYNLGMAGTVSASTVSAMVVPCTNGDHKRHIFSELVRAINPSGRRALQ